MKGRTAGWWHRALHQLAPFFCKAQREVDCLLLRFLEIVKNPLGSSLSHLASKEPVSQPQDLVVDELVASQLGQRLFEILDGFFMAVEQRTRVSPPHGGTLAAWYPLQMSPSLYLNLFGFSWVSPIPS